MVVWDGFLKSFVYWKKNVLNPDYHIDGKGGEFVDQVGKPWCYGRSVQYILPDS